MTARRRALTAAAAAGLVLVASLGVQLSAILAHGLFDHISPAGVSGLRFAIAGVVALAIVRPRLRGRSAGRWAAIGCFGVAIASMNAFLYLALERLPLGIALTLEFLGPFAVAILGIRRPKAALVPVAGFVGVVLIVRPTGDLDVWGVAWGLLAAVALGAYALRAERVGRAERGFEGLALALGVAAVLMSPFAASAAPALRWADAPVLGISALLGVVVAVAADTAAVRLTSARTVAVLLSLDPVLAALLGAVLLGQALDGVTWAGIALVAAAGPSSTRGGSAPDHGDAGVEECEHPDGPEECRRHGAALLLAGAADAHEGADDQQDDELDADLDVVEASLDAPRGGEDEAGDGGDRQTDVHETGEPHALGDGLDEPRAEQHGESDDVQVHDDVAQDLHAHSVACASLKVQTPASEPSAARPPRRAGARAARAPGRARAA